MDISQAFAQTLFRLRTERRLTHEVLAERAGLHPTTVSLLERAKRQPNIATIFKLADGLAVDPETLVKEVRKLRPKFRNN